MSAHSPTTQSRLGWWLTPISRGKYGGASRLTCLAALGFPISMTIVIVDIAVIPASMFKTPNTLVLGLELFSTGFLWVGVASVPLALALLIWDIIRAGPAREAAATAKRAQAHHDQEEARSKAEAEDGEVRVALAAFYAKHQHVLSAEIRRLLEADRYGRRDTEAAAREFSAFQEGVAEPTLVAQGHGRLLIQAAFQADKAELLGMIVQRF